MNDKKIIMTIGRRRGRSFLLCLNDTADFTSYLQTNCFFMSADDELLPSYWNNKAKEALHTALKIQPNVHKAKNVILFLGDGEFRTELCFLSYISIYNFEIFTTLSSKIFHRR